MRGIYPLPPNHPQQVIWLFYREDNRYLKISSETNTILQVEGQNQFTSAYSGILYSLQVSNLVSLIGLLYQILTWLY